MKNVGIDYFVNGGFLNAAVLAELLGGEGGGYKDTAITTAGDGALTAAALIGGQVTRTGPTGAFTDTTATGAQIVAALQGTQFQAGEAFQVTIKNATVWPQTISAGVGVTLPLTLLVPALSVMFYYGTVGGTAAAPTVTFGHTATVPLHQLQLLGSTALAGAGAATITAAGIAGQVTARSGQTAAAMDTSDVADSIIAAQPNLQVGQGFVWKYVNNGNFPITLAGGTGVTLAAVVPAHAWAEFLVTYTAADTIVMSLIEQGYFPKVGVTGAANGVTPVAVADARVTATSIITLSLNTVGGTVGIPHLATITPGTGFSFISSVSDTSTYNYKIEG